MNYQKIYNQLIQKRQIYTLSKKNTYCERHHIVPRSLGGSNDKTNLVNLTAREHYIAHLLLWKIYIGTSYEFSMNYALIKMTISSINHQRKYKYNSKLYEVARNRFSINLSNWWKTLKYDKRHDIICKISNSVKNNWKNMSYSEYTARCNNMAMSKKLFFDNLTAAEYEKYRKDLSIRNKNIWKNKSIDEKNRIIHKIQEKAWKTKTFEQKQAIIKKRVDTIKNRSKEQKENTRIKRNQTIANKTNEEKQKAFNNMSVAIKAAWKNRSSENINAFKQKISQSRKNRKYMYNNELKKCISVNIQDIEYYLSIGYKIGRRIYKNKL